MNAAAAHLLSQYDTHMRADARVAGCARETTAETARYTTQSGSLRYLLWHRFDDKAIDAVIEREVEAARGAAESLMWKVYAHDRPNANLSARLIVRGFAEKDHSTLMVAPVTRILEATATTASSLDVLPLTTPKSLDAYLQIWDDVWPGEPNARYVDDYRTLLEQQNDGVVFFGAFDGATPVSAGYMFHAPGSAFALLCGGSTRAAWRGRGVYASLIGARARRARERGAEYLAVEASPESLPILQRTGFTALSTLAFYELALDEA